MRAAQQIARKDYQEFHIGIEFLGISQRRFKENTSQH